MSRIAGFNWCSKDIIRKMSRIMGKGHYSFYLDKDISLCCLEFFSKSRIACNEDSSIHATLDGTIYNSNKSKKKLNKHRIISDNDAELITHLYEEYGEKCIGFLDGEFAFVLWDNNKKILFLGRDRIGVKQLYYYFKNGKFIFASEIKAILEHGIKKEMSLKALKDYLMLRYNPHPRTLFKDINELSPGHTLTLKENKISINKYWGLRFKIEKRPEKFFYDRLLDLIKTSIEERLPSTRFGAFLSGGLDSSTIVAIASKLTNKPIKTFSLGFESKEDYDELNYVKRISKLYGTEHYTTFINAEDVPRFLPNIVWQLDEPMASFGLVSSFIVSRLAAKYTNIVLTGDGGDELFGGYRQYVVPKLRWKIKGWESKKKTLDGFKIQDAMFDRKMRSDILKQPVKRKIGIESYVLKRYKSKIASLGNTHQFIYHHVKNWLPEEAMRIDKTTAMIPLEARSPFLDHNLFEFMATLPSSMKVRKSQTKYLFKKICSKFIPKSMVRRKKVGFVIPVDKWIRNQLKDYTIEILGDKELDRYFNREYINKLIRLHMSGNGFGAQIYTLLIFAIWHKLYMQNLKPKEIIS